MGFNVSETLPLTFIASATEGPPPCPPATEKKPILPPGGVGLGSNVIAQMKRRHTRDKELEGPRALPKDNVSKSAKVEGKGKWSWNSDEPPSPV